MNYNEAMEKLKRYGQEHVLKYYAELPDEQRNTLIEQIDRTDFTVIGQAAETGKRGTIAPIKAMTIPEIDMGRERFERIGMEAVKAGKLGAVLLAGGMGTRLGSDAPKGMYDIGISKPVYIFQRLIENLMKVVEKAGNYIQLFVMTSEKNHDATVGFFKEHDYFGYDKDYIAFFKQDMAPAADFDGKVYMEAKDSIATSPNGNGGWFLSMKKSGLLELVEKRGIEWLNVFAVDNVLQSIADPVFAGAVLEGGYSVGSKVIRKVNPQEKVGVMCTEDGRPSIVEYIELTEDMLTQRDENGEYAYNFGVILNYLFKVDKLVNLLERKLPYHKSAKKIPYINEAGELVKPEEPNGYKYEQFILDMIQMLDSCLPFEVVRGLMRKRLRVLVVLVNIAISMNFCIFEVKGETNENVQKESEIQIDKDYMREVIEEITFSPHPINSKEIDQVKKCIVSEFNKIGYDNIEYQKFEYNDEKNENAIRHSSQIDIFLAPTSEDNTSDGAGENVIIKKDSNQNTQKKLIISAHYDSSPTSLGANDNGSGVAIVLEIAQILKNIDMPYNIEFIMFSGEEKYMLGSRWYAGQLSEDEKDNIIGVINVDTVAEKSDLGYWIMVNGDKRNSDIDYESDDAMQKLAELNGNALSKLFQVNDRFSVVMAMNSDHYPFSLLDIPSVTIVQNLEEELKINDESDIKENLDYERMQEVVKCILRVAFELE